MSERPTVAPIVVDARPLRRGDTIEAEYRCRTAAYEGRRAVRLVLTHAWLLVDGLAFVSDGRSRYAVLVDSIRVVATLAAESVHWFPQGAVLGDPAQCGSQDGRATRVASEVTCRTCVAWMNDESWSARDVSAVACDLHEIAAQRDEHATEASALRVQLAAALAVQAEQANQLGDLRALLNAAGIPYIDRRRERTLLAPAPIGA